MERIGEVVWVPYGRSGSQLAVIIGAGSRPSRLTVRKYREASRSWSLAVEVSVSKIQPMQPHERAFLSSQGDIAKRFVSLGEVLPMDQRAKLFGWLGVAP